MNDQRITTPLRLLEVLAQGFRETIAETDAETGVPTDDDYARGFRDALTFLTDRMEQLILHLREKEM